MFLNLLFCIRSGPILPSSKMFLVCILLLIWKVKKYLKWNKICVKESGRTGFSSSWHGLTNTVHPSSFTNINQILNLYCDERRDVVGNIAWARGKSRGRSLRDLARAQAIFSSISQLKSQYRHSHWARIGLALLGVYFPVLHCWGLCRGSFHDSLGNTLCLEGYITSLFLSIPLLGDWECIRMWTRRGIHGQI